MAIGDSKFKGGIIKDYINLNYNDYCLLLYIVSSFDKQTYYYFHYIHIHKNKLTE